MKKLFILFLGFLMGSLLFAASYEVKVVAGKVTYAESAKSKAKPVTVGMIVQDETFITLGENSKIVLNVNNKNVTLRIPKKATVAEMIATRNEVASPLAKKGKGTATAASRASEVMTAKVLDE